MLALDSSGALGGVLRHEQFPGPGLNCTRCGEMIIYGLKCYKEIAMRF